MWIVNGQLATLLRWSGQKLLMSDALVHYGKKEAVYGNSSSYVITAQLAMCFHSQCIQLELSVQNVPKDHAVVISTKDFVSKYKVILFSLIRSVRYLVQLYKYIHMDKTDCIMQTGTEFISAHQKIKQKQSNNKLYR